jgi:hypothetical protein
MNCITKKLGAIGSAPSGGSTKMTIKARLPNSFARKETKNQANATMVAPSGGVYGKPMLQN